MTKSPFIQTVLASSLLSLSAGVSRADTTEVAAQQHPRRVFSLTISPVHLTAPIVELTGEARVLDKLGIAAVAGAGKLSSKETATAPKRSASAYEVGLQGRYYLLGDFRHGLQLGAEAMYLHVADDDPTFSATGKGLAIGPFVGYKYTADVGFTFDTQLGFQHISAAAEASHGVRQETAEDSGNIVLLNINVGWSF
jgi:hypothetical protein